MIVTSLLDSHGRERARSGASNFILTWQSRECHLTVPPRSVTLIRFLETVWIRSGESQTVTRAGVLKESVYFTHLLSRWRAVKKVITQESFLTAF